MMVDVAVVNQRACQVMYREPGSRLRPVISDNMFCAGMKLGKDTCNGDSGGPIVTETGVQVGVTSWGDGCADAFSPGVYARISSAMDFIQAGICALSSEEYRPTYCNESSVIEFMKKLN